MTLDNDFTQRLAQLRAERGLSQQELADITGIAAAQISRYESGKNAPRPGIVAKLAKALDVSMEYLSTGQIPFSKSLVTTTIELPSILRYQLEEEALKFRRTLTEEVAYRLEQSLTTSSNVALEALLTRLEFNIAEKESEVAHAKIMVNQLVYALAAAISSIPIKQSSTPETKAKIQAWEEVISSAYEFSGDDAITEAIKAHEKMLNAFYKVKDTEGGVKIHHLIQRPSSK